jgi:glucuronate isomerase
VAIYSRSRTKVFCRTDKDPNSKLKQHNQINDANGHHGDLGDKQIKSTPN